MTRICSSISAQDNDSYKTKMEMTLWSLFLCTLFFMIFVTSALNSETLVQTNSGPIQGKIVAGFTNKKAKAFYGIPYAEPPIGKLRFKPPVPVSPWTDVFDATRTPFPCYQQYTPELLALHRKLEIEVRRPWSEDCLTLNIWTPEVVPEDAPVKIYFHDGAFLTGTGAYPHFDLSTSSVETQSVLVSFNYRVGAFGFLTLGTSDSPGNLGLMDQHLAIKWVHDNIDTFGGKPSAIFLLGFGAGAASIGYQIILDQNAGLFKTGILIAGSPICSWAWQTKQYAVKLGRSLARHLDCHNESTDSVLSCFQKLHPEDIVDATIFESMHDQEFFKPNVDGIFIREPPMESMMAGRFNNNTVIVVNAVADAAPFFYTVNKDLLSEDEGLTDEGFDEALKRLRQGHSETDLKIAREWYLNNSTHTNLTNIRDIAVQVYSDVLSVCCTTAFLDYATEGGVLTYKAVLSLQAHGLPAWMASHSLAGFRLILAETLNPKRNYGAEEKKATEEIMVVARTYLRKKAEEFQKVVPLYNLKDRPYLNMGFVKKRLTDHRKHECELWNNIMPMIRSRRHECR